MASIVATTDELQPGERKFIEVNGLEIVVLNADGEYYAIRNFCPHMEGPVGRGPVSNSDNGQPTISCPFHEWTFDLESGEASFGRSKRLTTYDIEIEGNEIVVDL